VTVTTAIGVTALAEAIVDLDAIAANARLLAAAGTRRDTGTATRDTGSTGAGPELMAVVKADGFGHGLVPAARAALAGGATWVGVTSVHEALQIRAAGITAPVLSWLNPPGADFAALLSADVDVSAGSAAHLDAIGSAARSTGRTARVHLKIDTGMTRGGAPAADWPALVRLARDLERAGRLTVRAVWTHLACADEPGHPGVADQLRRFDAAYGAARRAGLTPALRHVANSAAILDIPDAHFDLLRAGVALYGAEPLSWRVAGLRPAMTVRAVVVEVTGTGAAVLAAGAGQGTPRAVAGKGAVWLDGRRRRIVEVTLDRLIVDATAAVPGATAAVPGAVPGATAVLFGSGALGEPTAAEWAAWAGTNPHEILTGFGARLPRRYPPVSDRPSGGDA
jgi:alanine racemase